MRVSHLKRRAEDDLKKGNYRTAADRCNCERAPDRHTVNSDNSTIKVAKSSKKGSTYMNNLKTPIFIHLSDRGITCPVCWCRYTEAINLLLPQAQFATHSTTQRLESSTSQPALVSASRASDLRSLLSNRSLAHMKAGKAAAAAADAAAAINLGPCWHKAHWRLAKALGVLGRWGTIRN